MMRKPALLKTLFTVAAALIVCAAARAQVEPAAFGASAKFDYDLSYTQVESIYTDDQESRQWGTVSGELQYLNGKPYSPMALTYSGGYSFGIRGPIGGSGLFQHLQFAQGYIRRKWSVSVSDNVTFSPETPTTGFSGIPGVGSFPGLPIGTPGPILYSQSVYNTLSGLFIHRLTHNMDFGLNTDYSIIRYPTGAALETNEFGLSPEFNWHLDARTSLSLQYSFAQYTYVGTSADLHSQSLQPGFSRVWNRRLTTYLHAGPQWIHSSFIPPSTGVGATLGGAYVTRAATVSANYYQGVSTGVGLGTEVGIRNYNATAQLSHTFGRDFTLSGSASDVRTQGLVQTGVVNGRYAALSATKRLGEFTTISAGYTVIKQSSSLTLPSSALTGLANVLSFSIAYHPRENHIFRK